MNNYNQIYDIQDVTAESSIPDEPVTLQEMKDYLRLEGFVDTDESSTESLSNFDYDDTLITNMIAAARAKLEKFLGVSIIYHQWKVVLTNGCGELELPYGPIQDFTSLKYSNGVSVDSTTYSLFGYDFQYLDEPYATKMVAEYEAGYEDCPEEIRLAIKQIVSYWYENRVNGGLPNMAAVMHLKRPWTWLA